MTSLKFKLQNYWSSWDFTFMMYKSSWKLIFIQIFAPNGFKDSRFVIDYAWISKLLRDATLTWRARELSSVLVNKVTYFREFGYLNSSYIRKSIIFKMFLSSWRDKFTLLSQNSVTDVSVGFRPPSGWAPAWRLHKNLYKFGEKKLLRISCVRNIAVTWILARVFAYLPSFFSRFWTDKEKTPSHESFVF